MQMSLTLRRSMKRRRRRQMISREVKEIEGDGGSLSDNSSSGCDNSNDSRSKKSKRRDDDGSWSANSSTQSKPIKTVDVPSLLFFEGESKDDALMMYDFLKVNKNLASRFNLGTKYIRGGGKRL